MVWIPFPKGEKIYKKSVCHHCDTHFFKIRYGYLVAQLPVAEAVR